MSFTPTTASVLFGLIIGMTGAAMQMKMADYWGSQNSWDWKDVAIATLPFLIAGGVTYFTLREAK